MQDMTNTNTTATHPFFLAIAARQQALFANPHFLRGVQAGLEAYEEHSEEIGRMLTAKEACATVSDELNPNMLAYEAEIARCTGESATSPAFRAGFVAGWIFTHLAGPVDLTLPCIEFLTPLAMPSLPQFS